EPNPRHFTQSLLRRCLCLGTASSNDLAGRRPARETSERDAPRRRVPRLHPRSSCRLYSLDIIAGTSGHGSADGTLIASGGTLAYGVPDSTSSVTVSNGAVDNLTGNIILQATTLLTVSAPITLTIHGQGLTLHSSDNLTTNAAIKTAGDISLSAGNTLSVGATIATTGGSVNLNSDGKPHHRRHVSCRAGQCQRHDHTQ